MLEYGRHALGVDITKLVDSETKELRLLMCCICFEYTCLKCLWVDEQGAKWDMCRECGVRERGRI